MVPEVIGEGIESYAPALIAREIVRLDSIGTRVFCGSQRAGADGATYRSLA